MTIRRESFSFGFIATSRCKFECRAYKQGLNSPRNRMRRTRGTFEMCARGRRTWLNNASGSIHRFFRRAPAPFTYHKYCIFIPHLSAINFLEPTEFIILQIIYTRYFPKEKSTSLARTNPRPSRIFHSSLLPYGVPIVSPFLSWNFVQLQFRSRRQ